MVRPRAFAGTRNRVERRKARKGIILRDVGISKKTQERYYNAVAKLMPVIESCTSMEAMDEMISDWIEKEFSKGMPLNTAADALSGIHYFIPASKKKSETAQQLETLCHMACCAASFRLAMRLLSLWNGVKTLTPWFAQGLRPLLVETTTLDAR
eukprot:s1144_g5.t1